jgi:hypothetical protein
MGANGITQATLIYFLTTFVTDIGEIFLEYLWNILKNPRKNHNFFFKIILFYEGSC